MTRPMLRLRIAFALSVLAAAAACSSEESGSSTPGGSDAGGGHDAAHPDGSDAGGGGGEDASAGDDAGDAGKGADAAKSGETCIGYGQSASCEGGLPPYGYVCFGGPPPDFSGCIETSASSLGNGYCCPSNDCVAQPDQDTACSGVSGKPHRFQCPPAGDGGTVPAPAGCVEHASGSTELEKFYCCP